MSDAFEQYVRALPEEAVSSCSRVRQLVHTIVPNVVEEISYGIPVFKIGKKYIFYLGAWKKHIGIYPIFSKFDFETEIAPYRSGKASVVFPYKSELPLGLIEKIIRARVAEIT